MKAACTSTAVWLSACATIMAQPAGQGASGDIAQLLDRKLDKLAISSLEIPAALAGIGQQAGVPIKIDDAAAELLPWGRQTKVADMTVSNASLREALPQILGSLGMTYAVQDGSLIVVATEPLKRVNRRATWEELKRLRWCNDTPYAPEKLEGLQVQYRITSKVDAPKMLQRQLDRSGKGSVAQMLEVACNSLGWVWLPEGEGVVIRTREAQIANQLARRITARYTSMALSKILNDLAERADVALFLEPGMMLKLPRSTAQSSTLLLDHGTIRQAFELLAAETGLSYEVTRDGIQVGLSEAISPASAASAAARRSPYVGKITIPGKDGAYSFDLLLTGEDLPPDILELREQIIDEYVEHMRKNMEAFVEKSLEDQTKSPAPDE